MKLYIKYIFITSLCFFFLKAYCQQNPKDISGLVFWLNGSGNVITDNDNRVLKWEDESGNLNHSSQAAQTKMPLQFKNYASLNNHHAIVFDGIDDELNFNEITTAKTFFIIFKHKTGIQDYAPVLGHHSKYDLIGGPGNKLFSIYTNNYIQKGSTKLNGESIAPLEITKPIQFSLLEIIGTSNVSFSNLSNERKNPARYWNGAYAEIIVYNKVLNTEEYETVYNYLKTKYSKKVDLGQDVVKNDLCPAEISANSNFRSYKWNTGETTPSIYAKNSGIYWVECVDSFGFKSSDTITVKFPGNFLVGDSTICLNDSIIWDLNLNPNNYEIKWWDEDNSQSKIIRNPGKYYVEVKDKNDCIYFSDTFKLQLDSFKNQVWLGNDTTLCKNDLLFIKGNSEVISSLIWNTGSTSKSIYIENSGSYMVQAFNYRECLFKDTIVITLKGEAPKVNFETLRVCEGNKMELFNQTSIDNNDISTLNWYFENELIGNQNRIVHEFPKPGPYEINLLIETKYGCNGNLRKKIFVPGLPSAKFEVYNTCEETTSLFIDKSTVVADTIKTLNWEIYDNTSTQIYNSTDDSAYFLFPHTGFFYVKLKAKSTSECIDSFQKKIHILPKEYCTTPNDLPGLSLWFNAQSKKFELDELNHVINWDNQANVLNPANQYVTNSQPKFIPKIPKLNGKAAVRFDGNDDFMEFNEEKKLKTLLFVVKHSTGKQDYPPLLGHTSSYDLIGGTDDKLFSIYTNPSVYKGVLRVNGKSQDPKEATKPTEYSLISLISNTALKASSIAKERQNTFRNWNGDYVEIIGYDSILSEESLIQIENYIFKKYSPNIQLADTIYATNFCPFELNLNGHYKKIYWNTGDTTSNITISKPGYYYYQTFNIFDIPKMDSVFVKFPGKYFSDTSFCLNNSIKWNIGLSKANFSFEWNDNSNDSILEISESGNYWVKIKDEFGCSFLSDSITVSIDSFAQKISLGPDTTFCSGNQIKLQKGAKETISYLWNDNSTKKWLTISETGEYWVRSTNYHGCIGVDTIYVNIKGKAPKIDLMYSNNCENDSMILTGLNLDSNGSEIVQWNWKVGESTVENRESVKIYFENTGNVTVTLRAVNNDECDQTVEKEISIYPRPKTNFEASNGCNGDLINFTDLSNISSGNIVNWKWTFDNQFSKFGKLISNSFKNAGSHTINLTTKSDQNCIDSLIQIINVFTKPKSNFNYLYTCKNEITELTQNVDTNGVGTVKLLWDFGGGLFSSLPKTKHYFETPGKYPVNLKATRIDNLCFHDTTILVQIFDLPKANFLNETLCKKNHYTFNNLSTINQDSILSYQWFLDGKLFSDEKEPELIVPTAETIDVSLVIVSFGGCKDSIGQKIKVSAPPVLDFSFTPEIGLPPLKVDFFNKSSSEDLSFTWSFGNGLNSNITNPSTTFNALGTYYPTLTGKNQFGCIDSISKQIKVEKPNVDIAIEDILTEYSVNNQLSISAKISNRGNLKVTNLKISSSIGKNLNLFEDWNGLLTPDSYVIYQFKSSIVTNAFEEYPIVCVKVDLNNQTNLEDVLDNNSFCKTIELKAIKIIPPKNPQSSTEDLNLDIFSNIEQKITFEFRDTFGKRLNNLEVTIEPGLNQLQFTLPNLRGVTFVTVLSNHSKQTFKILRF